MRYHTYTAPTIGYQWTSHTFMVETEPDEIMVRYFDDNDLHIYPNGVYRSYFRAHVEDESDLIEILKWVQEKRSIENLCNLLDAVEQKGELDK